MRDSRTNATRVPVMVLTPVLGEAATTSWPPRRRMGTVFEPIRPVPTMITIFIPSHPARSPQAGLVMVVRQAVVSESDPPRGDQGRLFHRKPPSETTVQEGCNRHPSIQRTRTRNAYVQAAGGYHAQDCLASRGGRSPR